MVGIPLQLVLLSSLFLATQATDVRGKIQWNGICSDARALGPSKVVLDNGILSGGVARDGSFIISDVPVGTYVLNVDSHDFVFEQLRIDVQEDMEPEVRPYVPGTPLDPPTAVLLPYPVKLAAKQKNVYFTPPESFNLAAMLSNPMILLMVFGGGMMLAMPYLMKNMDPESLEEFKGQQAKMARMQDAVTSGDLRSGFSALLGDDEPSNSPAGPATTPNKVSSSTAKKGKNKRR